MRQIKYKESDFSLALAGVTVPQHEPNFAERKQKEKSLFVHFKTQFLLLCKEFNWQLPKKSALQVNQVVKKEYETKTSILMSVVAITLIIKRPGK